MWDGIPFGNFKNVLIQDSLATPNFAKATLSSATQIDTQMIMSINKGSFFLFISDSSNFKK